MYPSTDPYSMFNLGSAGATGSNFLPYLAMANFLLSPPRGPQGTTVIGSPMQGSQPMVSQAQPWGPTAASGAMRGAMAGAPFGPPGMAIGGTAGYASGKK